MSGSWNFEAYHFIGGAFENMDENGHINIVLILLEMPSLSSL